MKVYKFQLTSMKAFGDRGGIDEISFAQKADKMLVDISEFDSSSDGGHQVFATVVSIVITAIHDRSLHLSNIRC